MAYGVFGGATLNYLADPADESLYIVNVEGEVTSDLNISHQDVLAAIVEAAKAYVDIGVDGIEYDVDGWSARPQVASMSACSLHLTPG